MIRKFYSKNILRYTVLLLIVFLFYLFPEKNNLPDTTATYQDINPKYHDIFLIDKNNYISKTTVSVNSIEKDKLVKELIEVMIIDGKYQNRIPNGFNAILPSDTQLLDIKIDNDTVKLNFNENLLDVRSDYEEKIIEAIIYTVTTVENIKNVELNINGKILETLPKSGKRIDKVLNRDYGINKEYDIENLDNITRVTIYYLSKNNKDETYYIPVTKYINSNEEKIKIIVDELSSNISYESNLISYLNYNAKLINYNFDEGELDLNFNEYLFDNENNKKVLEEVIYSISYSIKDNYDVSKINFFVNNKQI